MKDVSHFFCFTFVLIESIIFHWPKALSTRKTFEKPIKLENAFSNYKEKRIFEEETVAHFSPLLFQPYFIMIPYSFSSLSL